jgi:pyruvate formate lyase activating enzyme
MQNDCIAKLWQKKDDNKVQCELCSHRCLVKTGSRGLCGVRENRQGQLFSLNYAKAIAAHLDPIEKKPLYHFLPGSDVFSIASAGCNFRCNFCQNWQISQITKGKDAKIIGEYFPPQEVISLAIKHQAQSVAYTYTEPTIFFEYAHDTAKLAQQQNLKNVFVTNGYQTDKAIKLMSGLIDAVNIDLKSFNNDYYQKVCGASLKPVLNSISKMFEEGIWVEITTLVVPGQNDSEKELKQIAEFIADIDENIPWHISRFFPTYKMTNSIATPIPTIEKAYQIGKEVGLNFVYVGNVKKDEASNTYCPQCSSLLIKRTGYMVQNLLEGDTCPQCQTRLRGIFQ